MSYITLRRKREAINIFLEEVVERFKISKNLKSMITRAFFLLKGKRKSVSYLVKEWD